MVSSSSWTSRTTEIGRVLAPGGVAILYLHGLGHSIRYLLKSDIWKRCAYAARTIVNTAVYRLLGRRLPEFLGDILFQSEVSLRRCYRAAGRSSSAMWCGRERPSDHRTGSVGHLGRTPDRRGCVRMTLSPYISGSVIDSAVALLIVDAGTAVNAMTISFFSEGAHHPATVWVSVSPTTYTHELITQAGRFSLVVLHEAQWQIAMTCGTVSGRERDKGSALDLYRSPAAFPFLAGALASTACRVRQTMPLGEHTLFVADILEADVESRSHRRHLLVGDLLGRAQ